MNRVLDKNRKRAKRKVHIRKHISGTATKPRMTVFRSNMHMYVQVIDDVAGNTLVSANSMEAELRELKNTVADAAKLGEVVGKRLLEKNIDSVVFDRNGYLFHGIVKSIADGARKAGIKF
ncbi:MAG: 50S ribosomal protein L18 [Spirochaetae bacterium HGW-Spirochaetae-4]|jgi:large subunit ribosomal protein L18|nr:50S ribosomal protein L18 [Sphaerochaeta sp.]OHD31746.1 MAG: 50S ribosomal protein L18 [Spirochaetes bacterium GWC2_52_13]OHD68231.1 MAG: 50S ribosomal protein L18 [Spirochaetes bacterium GWF2_52_7]PKL22688.1 MAG: 50S ribosomal protein L18 [Spirochaetae bacterium HGW-Spirochaetae-4]HCG63135.1 50S ribosomal protein L18 [Sphaerochaeta sp.]